MAERIDPKVIRFGLLGGLAILPALLLLNRAGRTDLDYPVLAAFAAIAFAVRGRWDLRRNWWFWVTISLIISLHLALIWFIPWKAGWVPVPVTLFAAVADLALLFGVISFVEKVMGGKPQGSNAVEESESNG